MKVSLTEVEQKIFSLLLTINQKHSLGITFRVAGGWVRDKALGIDSDDIDIALDNMTGAAFGKYLQMELGRTGNVIKANPEQSKHLETLTVTLCGRDVDFVNLRSERYDVSSRIPKMMIGTPTEDAERRDLTINALFYNINTDEIEDFTGKAKDDLASMVLRTPLYPLKTFLDDPLRILRLLRFYSRFKGSTIDPLVLKAMRNPGVLMALQDKVSEERVYTEIIKLFAGQQASAAFRVMYETGVWEALFGRYLRCELGAFYPFTMDQRNRWHIDNVLEHTLKVLDGYDAILRDDGAGDQERALSNWSAVLHDTGKLSPEMMGIKPTVERVFRSYHGHEDVSERVTRAIMQGLKASNEETEYVCNIVLYHMQPHDDMTDKQLRKLVRELGRNVVRRIIQHAKADATSKPGGDVAHYDRLLERATTIEQLENKKPVLDGQTLMSMFPTLNPSTGFMREINVRLQDVMDTDPTTSRERYIELVEDMRTEMIDKYQNFVKAKKPTA